MADYATLEELKAYIGGFKVEDTKDDTVLELSIAAASEAIDQYTDNPITGDIPAGIKQACLIQAMRLYKRRVAPFGVAGNPQLGSEIELRSKLDPDVEVHARPYRVMWGAVSHESE